MPAEVVVAGHICLDIIPGFQSKEEMTPGALLYMGPAVVSTGGAVANTGLALHQLGVPVRLAGKVGDDFFGRGVREVLERRGSGLGSGLRVDPASTTSYSVVISPPGTDRTFLHHQGANDHFTAADLPSDTLAGARLLHFGYPTLMRSLYADGGEQMVSIFRKAREQGLATSLDMSLPDPKSEAARVDWPAWLARVLPLVDIFLPSLDETRLMLGTDEEPAELAARLHGWGAGIVGLKMGARGLFCRWDNRDYHAPCFEVEVAGTTGSGDSTIAGFLAGWLRGLPPGEVMEMAVAVGACCCEAPDATSGIQSWENTRRRISNGWKRKTS